MMAEPGYPPHNVLLGAVTKHKDLFPLPHCTVGRLMEHILTPSLMSRCQALDRLSIKQAFTVIGR